MRKSNTFKAALSLLLVFLTIALSSCVTPEKPDDTTVAPATTATVTEENLIADIPVVKYDRDFTILSRDGSSYTQEIWCETESADPVDSAVVERNNIIKETFGINITAYTVNSPSEDELGNMLRRSIDSGDHAYDLVLCHTVNAGFMAAEGYFYNIKDLPIIDFEKPWWNKDIIDSLTIGNSLYLVTNDFSLHSMQYAWCMVYNKNLASKYDLPSIYKLVDDGEWTVDKLYELAKIASKENGDSKYDQKDDYGLGINWWGGTIALMYSQGQTVTKRGEDGYPYIDFKTERMQHIVENIYNLLYTDHCCLTPEYMPTVYNNFTEGRMLFAAVVMNETDNFREMTDDFGIIPLPKYDKDQQKYYSLVDGHASIICVPRNITDPEMTGTVMEALAALSYNTVVPAYYEKKIQGQVTRDSESYRMLDIVLNSRIYDFGYIYDLNGLAFLIYQMMEGKNTDFASAYSTKEAGAQNKLIAIIESYSSRESE